MPPTPQPTPQHASTPAHAARVAAIACGKHPGWAEQVDGVGRASPALGACKRALWTLGFAPAQDRDVWSAIPADQRADPIAHDLLWLQGGSAARAGQGSAACVVGRAWASKDQRGRLGVMLALASVEGVDTSWHLENVLPRLRAAEAMCRETSAPELVRLALGECTHQVEDALATTLGSPRGGATDAQSLAHLARASGWNAPRSGKAEQLARVRNMLRAGKPHVRLPSLLENSEDLQAWGACVRTLLDGADPRPMLLMRRDGAPFVECFLGGPDPSTLSVLRARSEHTPCATAGAPSAAAPALEDQQRCDALLSDWEKEPPSAARVPIAPVDRPSARTIAALSLSALLLGALAWWLLSPSPPDREHATLPSAQTNPQPHAPLVREAPPSNAQPDAPPVRTATDQPSEAPRPGALAQRAALLEDELARALEEETAQQRAPDEDLRSRVAQVAARARRDSASADPTLADDLASTEHDVAGLRAEAAGRVLAYLRERAARAPALRDELANAYRDGLGRIEPRKGMAPARARADALLGELVRFERRWFEAGALSVDDSDDYDAHLLEAKAEEARMRALRDGGTALAQGDARAGDGALSDLHAWCDHARGAMQTAGACDDALRAARTLEEPSPLGTLADLSARLRAHAQACNASDAFRTLDQRIALQERSANATTPVDALHMLEDAADASGLRVGTVREALQSLGRAGWPGTPEEVGTLAQMLQQRVDPAVDAMAEEQRAHARAAVREQVGGLWRDFFGTRAKTDADVRAALDAMTPLGVDEETELARTGDSALPAWAKFDVARDALARGQDGPPADARAAAALFVQHAHAWKDLETPAMHTLRDTASALAQGSPEGTPSLGSFGPGAGGWRAQAESPTRVTFVAPDGTPATFESLSAPSNAERVTFLGTTEVSVAQVMAVVNAPGAANDDKGAVLALLPDAPLGVADPRPGPRTWARARTGLSLPQFNSSGGWVRLRGAHVPYPASVVVAPVSGAMPMQYVPPSAALALAHAMGCRLPTLPEWLGACGGDAERAARGANLRDATWTKVEAHLKELGADAPFSVDALGTFLGATHATTPESDGVLWFMPVDQTVGPSAAGAAKPGELAAGPFLNMVGNVAELVVDDAASLERIDAAQADWGALAEGAGVQVVGASALSPPERSPVQAEKVDARRATQGWSDVGFRLAFSVPRSALKPSAAQDLRTALAQQPPLTPTMPQGLREKPR